MHHSVTLTACFLLFCSPSVARVGTSATPSTTSVEYCRCLTFNLQHLSLRFSITLLLFSHDYTYIANNCFRTHNFLWISIARTLIDEDQLCNYFEAKMYAAPGWRLIAVGWVSCLVMGRHPSINYKQKPPLRVPTLRAWPRVIATRGRKNIRPATDLR